MGRTSLFAAESLADQGGRLGCAGDARSGGSVADRSRRAFNSFRGFAIVMIFQDSAAWSGLILPSSLVLPK
ncbi:MAG: hypothetical protein N2C14_25440 [Planctomycetales bacterium]